MGFLSRKKPKPAPVEIEEQHPIVDELKQMEEAVPERSVEPESSGTEELRAAGPVSDGDSPAEPENSPSSPSAGEAAEAEGSDAPAVAEAEHSAEEVTAEAPAAEAVEEAGSAEEPSAEEAPAAEAAEDAADEAAGDDDAQTDESEQG